MQIRIATRHGHLSDATRERVEAKAEKLLRFFDRLTEIEVIIDLKKEDAPRVDIKCSAKQKHDFVAHVESDNLMAAVDAAVQKLEQQLRRHKERVQQRHRQTDPRRQDGAKLDQADLEPIPGELDDVEEPE